MTGWGRIVAVPGVVSDVAVAEVRTAVVVAVIVSRIEVPVVVAGISISIEVTDVAVPVSIPGARHGQRWGGHCGDAGDTDAEQHATDPPRFAIVDHCGTPASATDHVDASR